MLTLLMLSLMTLVYNIQPLKAEPTVIVIDDPEYTWYGDLIVNATDTVIIENSNLTVENGMIYVYGTMNVTNSTIWMRYPSYRTKTVYVYSNFTMINSQIQKNNMIRCYSNSHVSVVNSSTSTTFLYVLYNSDVYVFNSTLHRIDNVGGKLSLLNSDYYFGAFYFYYGDTTSFASNSNISRIVLVNPYYAGNLELRPGLTEDLTIYSESYSVNFTLVNSYVDDWYFLYMGGFEGKFINSILGTFDFEIDPTWSGNLTLTSGYIEYLEMNSTYTSVIFENSTVNAWRPNVGGSSSVQILNSPNIIIDVYQSPEVSILNSSATYLCVYEDFSGTLLATNTTINSAEIRVMDASVNLTLHEGFHEFFNLDIPEQGRNITLVDSTVDHWSIVLYPNSSLNLFNSNLTKNFSGWGGGNLHVSDNSSSSVYNSNLESVSLSGSSDLTLINSTVNTLYAYGDSNVTAINSTINQLITEPIQASLINSRILLQLDFSLEMTDEDSITSTFSEEYEPSLPENIQRFGQYVNITTTYGDYFEVQVRIYYNETEIEEVGIDEARLEMYYLNESNVWQLCPIQSVNIVDNYVWANVTHFSGFVLGVHIIHDIAVTDVTSSKTVAGQSYNLSISAVIVNEGEHTETFNVTAYANTTIIETHTDITLISEESRTITFTWNTTDFENSNYTISAYATPVLYETNTADNSLVKGFVMVTIPGDTNGDRTVNILDAGVVSSHWYPGPPIGPLGYSGNADINNDGEVDIFDAAIISVHWQESW